MLETAPDASPSRAESCRLLTLSLRLPTSRPHGAEQIVLHDASLPWSCSRRGLGPAVAGPRRQRRPSLQPDSRAPSRSSSGEASATRRSGPGRRPRPRRPRAGARHQPAWRRPRPRAGCAAASAARRLAGGSTARAGPPLLVRGGTWKIQLRGRGIHASGVVRGTLALDRAPEGRGVFRVGDEDVDNRFDVAGDLRSTGFARRPGSRRRATGTLCHHTRPCRGAASVDPRRRGRAEHRVVRRHVPEARRLHGEGGREPAATPSSRRAPTRRRSSCST